MRQLRIYAAAREEFEAAVDWYAAQSAQAAERFEIAVGEKIESIRRVPEQYAKWDDRHQFALVHKFPYYVAYRAFPNRIEIVAIRHASRDSSDWTDR